MPTIGAVSATAPPSATNDALAGLDGQAFLRLLVAQLRYQNPLAPSDPAAMLQQTSALRQVETLQQLAATQHQLMRFSQAAMSTDLVGKHVVAVDPNGQDIAGIVDGVRFTDTGPVLVIGDRTVAFDATVEIATAPTRPTAP